VLVSNTWLGTSHMCDCLERSSDRRYFLNIICDKKGKHPKHASTDCYDVPGAPPRTLSSVNGIKVCGKRAQGMSLSQAVRPSRGSNGHYSCPTGYKACQESWLEDPAAVEFVFCVRQDLKPADVCPITSFAYTLSGMSAENAAKYFSAPTINSSRSDKFYFSKTVAQMPIDDIKLSAAPPCWNKRNTRSANQEFYYAEIGGQGGFCTQYNTVSYQELPLAVPLNELDFQKENGLLQQLRESVHYTYRFFPDDSGKKNVQMLAQ